MRPRIKKQVHDTAWCTTTRGCTKGILTERIQRKPKTMTDHMEELKSQLREAVSREKYAIREVGGERVIYMLTRNGYFGNGIFC